MRMQVNLRGNRLGPEGAKAIAKGITVMASVTQAMHSRNSALEVHTFEMSLFITD